MTVLVIIVVAVFIGIFWMYFRWRKFKQNIWLSQYLVISEAFPGLRQDELYVKMLTDEYTNIRWQLQNIPDLNHVSEDELLHATKRAMQQAGLIQQ